MLTQAVLEEQCPLFTLSHWMNDNHINHIDLLKVIMACAVQWLYHNGIIEIGFLLLRRCTCPLKQTSFVAASLYMHSETNIICCRVVVHAL